MELGKTIEKLPLADEVNGDMKIPTGGFGDLAVTIDQVRVFVQTSSRVHYTNNPALQIRNGKLQRLDLLASGMLTADFPSGGFISVKVTGEYDLDISKFTNVNGFVRDKRFECSILIFDYLGERLLLGSNYIESTDSIPPPIEGPTISCEGAGNWVNFYMYQPIGEELNTEGLEAYFDDVLYPEDQPLPSWVGFDVPPPRDPPTGYQLSASVQYYNNQQSTNHTVRVKVLDGFDKLVEFVSDYPTATIEEWKEVGVCLTNQLA